MPDFDNSVSSSDAENLKKVISDVVDDGQHKLEENFSRAKASLNQTTAQKSDPIRDGQDRLEESSQKLDQLAAKIKSESNLKPEDKIRIQIGSRKVFSGKGDAPTDSISILSHRELEKVDNFLQDKPIDGSFKVNVNGSPTPDFYMKDGKIKRNEIQYQAPQQQKVKPSESPSDLRIEALQKQLAVQQAQLNELSNRIKVIEQRPVVLANPTLSDWVNGLKNRFKLHLQQQQQNLKVKVEQGKQAVSEKVGQGKQAVSEKVEQGKQAVSGKVEQGKQAVFDKVEQGKKAVAAAWMATVVQPSVEKILDAYGDKGPDGSKTLSTQEYNLTKSPQGEISISRKSDGLSVTPDNLNGRDQQVLTALSKQGEKIDQVQGQKSQVQVQKKPKPPAVKITPKM